MLGNVRDSRAVTPVIETTVEARSQESIPLQAASHDEMREFRSWLLMVVSSALFVVGLSVPALAKAVGVTAGDGLLAVSVFLVAGTLATVAYHWLGPGSRSYVVFDKLEGFAGSFAVGYVIHASGSALSFFWFFYFVQVVMHAASGIGFLYALTIAATPLGLAIAFAFQQDAVSAWLSLVCCGLGLVMYLVIGRVYSELEASRRREAQLRIDLAAARVQKERVRISRDLHDGVATELTALIWKTRAMSKRVPVGTPKEELEGIAERLVATLSALRTVVLSLRQSPLTFSEANLLLEQRCRELCGSRELKLDVRGTCEEGELERFRDDVLPMCFELVHNAAAHSGAASVSLSIDVGSALVIRVVDDGSGLNPETWQETRGGLLGVRRRAAGLGGTTCLPSSERGTQVVVQLPRPLRRMGTTLSEAEQ
jgi:signal transduction histidine kinase